MTVVNAGPVPLVLVSSAWHQHFRDQDDILHFTQATSNRPKAKRFDGLKRTDDPFISVNLAGHEASQSQSLGYRMVHCLWTDLKVTLKAQQDNNCTLIKLLNSYH